jgi:glutamate--cysteine ligase catalytic subunit
LRNAPQRSFGLLTVGEPLSFEDSIKHSEYIRKHGVLQFLACYNRVKDLANDRLFYGDEIEHAILKLDRGKRTAKVSLRASAVMDELRAREQSTQPIGDGCAWHQEYGSWMLEGTPALPYGAYTSSLLQMEYNMRLRRARLVNALAEDEIAPTVVNFPHMGVGDFTSPSASPGGAASESSSVPDSCINPHPRFGTLTANIRKRRGSKVDIRVPVFKDVATLGPPNQEIEMDCMAYGMGCCCLQVTFQACDIDESRYLYDQLAPLAPIMLALTAAAPIHRGMLGAVDARWGVISASVDDRTPAERGEAAAVNAKPIPELAGGAVTPLSKSRYDSISCYIHPYSESFNDIPCEVDDSFVKMLLERGTDGALARHIAHLFVRDPLVVFEGAVEEANDNESTEHFDSINSTNWQTVRWKPPPLQETDKPHIGWRTEFRSMEVQLTDFENAAFSAFMVLISRVLLVFDLDFLAPLSKVDENMRRAMRMDAVANETFWFRHHVLPSRKLLDSTEEMTMHEIISGKGEFPGLVPLCYAYLEHIQCDSKAFERIDQYLAFIQKRASGELMTPAAWMRQFVQNHPDYKQDSVVTDSISYDLMVACDEIGRGVRSCPEIHGEVVIDRILNEGIYGTVLESSTSHKARAKLLEQLVARASKQDGPGSLPTSPLRERFCVTASAE